MQISNAAYVSFSVMPSTPTQNGALLADRQLVDANGQRSEDAEQNAQIQSLKQRDKEVRDHEQAHLSAAGGIAGAPRFQFVIGPDGQRYAVGGEVSIDTSVVSNDPAATISKAEAIRRAALAPAQPSAQDYSVASKAAAMISQAYAEILRTQQGLESGGSHVDTRV